MHRNNCRLYWRHTNMGIDKQIHPLQGTTFSAAGWNNCLWCGHPLSLVFKTGLHVSLVIILEINGVTQKQTRGSDPGGVLWGADRCPLSRRHPALELVQAPEDQTLQVSLWGGPGSSWEGCNSHCRWDVMNSTSVASGLRNYVFPPFKY